jgi:hypothetical protein
MLRLAADENFNHNIVRGLRRRLPLLDLLTIQEAGISGADDPSVLEWAAQEQRVLLTHDVATMVHFAYERIERGDLMSGVFEIRRSLPTSQVIDELVLIAECSLPNEWEGQVRFLPLR